jgi:leukotriene A-4 hydrolase/aminopeptidase
MAKIDPHSNYDTTHPRARHLHLKWTIDVHHRQIRGSVALELDKASGGPIDLDTKSIEIQSVVDQEGRAVCYSLKDEEPVLGSRLRLELPEGTKSVTIRYATSPDAVAMQWLEPHMTVGQRHPFLYSQCQPIHARSILPCQDTPRVRVSYSAEVTVPNPLTVIMSAGSAGKRRDEENKNCTFLFEMPQPIPPYLFAVAAGDLQSQDLSPRARVWAEPEMIDAAAYEFGEVEQIIETAERLFGPYEWERYDMLVLPPAFPYGGMENPRITFLTPTLIAGDRSLVDVIAHELAHSWTGNLVTNATMEHFWLNEGFTTWAERRIVKALRGEASSALRWAIGKNSLDESMARFGTDSSFTRLRTDLTGVDPDEVYSTVPYEKGALFVTALERQVGLERFDRFIREYINRFRFTSITTEEFIDFLDRELPGISGAVNARQWLYETGLPSNAPVFQSQMLNELQAAAHNFAAGKRPSVQQISGWDWSELLVFLQHLPRELDIDSLAWLDKNFELTARGNYEILVEWLTIAAGSDYEAAFESVRRVLRGVGRMKYLRPLYKALGNHARTRQIARETYENCKASYHSLSRRVIESVMKEYAEDHP